MSEHAILLSALAILLLPLLSYAILFFFGKKLPRQGDWLGVTLLGAAWLLAVRIFAHFWAAGDPGLRIEGGVRWLDLGVFTADAGILVDGMTAIMLVVVTTVSFLVHLFSVGYMHGDRRYERFFAFLGFFTFSMLGIVLSNSLLFLYVFWELVGLASYLLIGFFFHKPSAAAANKKAFLTNRVGDFGFFIGILIFFTAYGTFNYFELFARRAPAPAVGRPADAGGRRPVHGLRRQVGAGPAAHLAARRHGRPHAGQRPDPRRDDGRRRRLHGRPPAAAVRPGRPAGGRLRGRDHGLPGARPSPWSRPTSRSPWPTPPSASSATW